MEEIQNINFKPLTKIKIKPIEHILITQHIRKGMKKRIIKSNTNNKPKYIIISKGKPVGIMAAYKIDDNHIGIGFSRYNFSTTMKFNPKKKQYIEIPLETNPFNNNFGINIATNRAIDYFDKHRTPLFILKPHPKYVKRQFIRFVERANKYFKDCELPPWFKYYESNDLFNKADMKHFKKG